ncbi:MAG: polyphosphate polymerase domain-containing protein [Eubacteriales bacterium]|jgi:hypothetical protein|nr:polyphosphate polymerase domain-containing protein [Eubacteriales bacterium]
MAIKTFKRYEEKFIVSKTDVNLLLPEIKRHMTPDAYCIDGSTYPTYNIYFDNETNEIIRHSVSKPSFKEKLRMRSYYADPGPDQTMFIEIKKKIGKIVCKRRAALRCKEAHAFVENHEYPENCDFMQRQVLGEIEYFIKIHNAKPAVYIRYDRYAFFDKENPRIRLTFDSNIHTRRDRLYFACGTDGELLLDNKTYIMEVKITGAMPLWLTGLLSELGIYHTGFSKYGSEYAAHRLISDLSV